MTNNKEATAGNQKKPQESPSSSWAPSWILSPSSASARKKASSTLGYRGFVNTDNFKSGNIVSGHSTSSISTDKLPTNSSNSNRWNYSFSSSTSRKKHQQQQQQQQQPKMMLSYLTLLLISLNENMEEYCNLLSDGATIENASNATNILDSLITTTAAGSDKSSPIRSKSKSPPHVSMRKDAMNKSAGLSSSERGMEAGSSKGRHHQQQRRNSSPWNKEKILLSTAYASSSDSSVAPNAITGSASLLQQIQIDEFDKYVSPLVLLAGAETVYSNMSHVSELGPTKDALTSLYERIAKDLQIVEETLCHPYLFNGNNMDTSQQWQKLQNTNENYQIACNAASSLANTLGDILIYIDIRCQLIQLHCCNIFKHDADDAVEGPESNHEAEFTAMTEKLQELLSKLNKNNADSKSNGTAVKKQHQLTAPVAQQNQRSSPEHFQQPPTSQQQNSKGQENKQIASSSAASSMLFSLSLEIKTLMSAMSAIHYLQHCRFLDTIIRVKKMKNFVLRSKRKARTVTQLWFRHILEEIISIMPIFFDRISSFAKPLYGFDQHYMTDTCSTKSATKSSQRRIGVIHDYDEVIIDFLRRHVSKGGPPLAVTIILDAEQTENIHSERGYQYSSNGVSVKRQTDESNDAKNSTKIDTFNALFTMSDKTKKHDEGPESNATISASDPCVLWPAIYMRSTMHTASSTFPSTTSGSPNKDGHRRSNSSSTVSGNTDSGTVGAGDKHRRSNSSVVSNSAFKISQTLLTSFGSMRDVSKSETPAPLSTQSRGSNSPKGTILTSLSTDSRSKNKHHRTSTHVAEYAGDSRGTSSWPHTEWGKLVHVICNNDLVAIGQANERDSAAEHNGISQDNTLRRSNSTASINTSVRTHVPAPECTSTYYSIRLNTVMWMVVILKMEKEGDSNWLRGKARKGHTNEDIRLFLTDISSNLKIKQNLLHHLQNILVESSQTTGTTNKTKNKETSSPKLPPSTKTNRRGKRRQSGVSITVPAVTGSAVDIQKYWKGEWTTSSTNELLGALKGKFRLRQSSSRRKIQPLKSPYQRFSSGGAEKRHRSIKKGIFSPTWSDNSDDSKDDQEEDILADAMMSYFMGPELHQSVLYS